MKEPEISVGIVNAQEIHFSLNGNFFAKGETVCGEQQVAFSEGGILWNGKSLPRTDLHSTRRTCLVFII